MFRDEILTSTLSFTRLRMTFSRPSGMLSHPYNSNILRFPFSQMLIDKNSFMCLCWRCFSIYSSYHNNPAFLNCRIVVSILSIAAVFSPWTNPIPQSKQSSITDWDGQKESSLFWACHTAYNQDRIALLSNANVPTTYNFDNRDLLYSKFCNIHSLISLPWRLKKAKCCDLQNILKMQHTVLRTLCIL